MTTVEELRAALIDGRGMLVGRARDLDNLIVAVRAGGIDLNGTCVWHIHPDWTELDGVFITSCGRTVELGENEPEEVYTHCPYCGKLIHWDHMA